MARNRHASVVAFGPDRAVVILGASGAGKSRLALGLIDRGAQLVADDQVFLTSNNGRLFASAPRAIAGLIEARGIGLLRLPYRRLARVALAVELTDAPVSRLPDWKTQSFESIDIPIVKTHYHETLPTVLMSYLRHGGVRSGIDA